MSPAAAARTELVRACWSEPVARTPVWFMRQAGRSLPEYRAARGDGSILSAIADAPLAAELTLQPVRRYGVDAAILFSDIVVPVHAIGFGIDVEQGRGPVVAEPFRSQADLTRLRPFEPGVDAPYVAETVRLVSRELAGSGTALIGFAGAPFTVASYLVEGGPSRTFAAVKALMHGDPALWDELPAGWPPWRLRRCATKWRPGPRRCSSSTHGPVRSPRRVRALRPPRHARGPRGRRRTSRSRPSSSALAPASSSRSWRQLAPRSWAWTGACRWPRRAARVGPDCARAGKPRPGAVPRALARGRGGDARRARRAARRSGPGGGHVFNLGHGVLPETDPGVLAAVVELVHAETDASDDVRSPRHGPRHSGPPRGHRGLLHADPPGSTARAGAVGRAGGPLLGDRRCVPVGRAHAGTGRCAACRARAPGAGPFRRDLRRQARRPPH